MAVSAVASGTNLSFADSSESHFGRSQ